MVAAGRRAAAACEKRDMYLLFAVCIREEWGVRVRVYGSDERNRDVQTQTQTKTQTHSPHGVFLDVAHKLIVLLVV